MPTIEILVEGYGREESDGEHASSTVTLIRDGGVNIVVDPGMDRRALLNGLAKHGLETKDVHFVALTHMHADHCLLASIFENAQVVDNDSIYTFDGKIGEHDGAIPGTGVKIVKTPGHDQFHCSFLVETEDLGKVVVAGDVFWWWDEEKRQTDRQSLLGRKDPYVKDAAALKKSREKLLALADYIIPGHGKMFQVV